MGPKTCIYCHLAKPLSDFYKNPATRDGCSSRCKQCHRLPKLPKRNLTDKFWARVSVGGPSDCWVWTTRMTRYGYGRFSLHKGCDVQAHRFSYTLAFGEIPEGLCVLHHCDNRACVNPRHLFLGTHKDNSQDMVAKKRQARGDTHPQAKLSARDVLAIRAAASSGEKQNATARLYDVSTTTVSLILKRKTWRHV